ncbi:hypothetical protein WOLCODRAFT_136326 [Wolfiporia cocos MD-104 SS10]|uniref:Uncharacterized protein n=1 Tax=Wolfiporia cocos (strain MD-104) TaxID=742152 RepID=A0A2H3JFF1_WOLCO|nr:hypothetical protein WOLCODRAFT_136326 [Wolfiporia cocos MD-104 SS10]
MLIKDREENEVGTRSQGASFVATKLSAYECVHELIVDGVEQRKNSLVHVIILVNFPRHESRLRLISLRQSCLCTTAAAAEFLQEMRIRELIGSEQKTLSISFSHDRDDTGD